MFYRSIELVNYKRFSLNGINYFKADFTQRLQLILGSNGSGKSSLLRELTPLPASPNDYYKNGCKKIVIDQNGAIYCLTSDFCKPKPHSFKVNETELNEGGTATIQRELVWQHFKITSDIHDLLLGVTKFHAMGPAERRKWFTQLSETDYDYAIGVYQKLRDGHRDVLGAIKITSARLMKETQSLLTSDKEQEIHVEVDELRQHIESLLRLKSPLAYDVPKLTDSVNTIDLTIKEMTSQLFSLIRQLGSYSPFKSSQEFNDAIINKKSEARHLSTAIEELSKKIQNDQHLLTLLTKTNLTNIAELENQCRQLEKKIIKEEKKKRIGLIFADSALASQAFDAVKNSLEIIFATLAPNPNHVYCRTYYEKNIQSQKDCENQLKEIEKEQLRYIKEKERLEEDKANHEIACPECRHRWYRSYNKERYDAVVKGLSQLEQRRAILETTHKEITQELERITEYMKIYMEYSAIRRGWTLLDPLWSAIDNTGYLFSSPPSLIDFLAHVSIDNAIDIDVQRLTLRKQEIDDLLARSKNDELVSTENLIALISQNDGRLHELICCLDKTDKEIIEYEAYKKQWISLETLHVDLEADVEKRNDLVELVKTALDKKAVNEMLQYAYIALSTREQKLSEITLQNEIVNDLQRQLETYEKQKEAYSDLIAELSPVDGLIARGLLGFINHVIDQMNEFIRRVWFYPLALLHCECDNDSEIDLDYKFPVQINDGDITPDISKTSSAMKEVIDLAFRVVCMSYLHLSNSALYLDEFAAMMDDAHRISAFKMIGELVSASEFSQVFVVSHYQSLYGSLSNAEITVLCENNIQLKSGFVFNTHITMH